MPQPATSAGLNLLDPLGNGHDTGISDSGVFGALVAGHPFPGYGDVMASYDLVAHGVGGTDPLTDRVSGNTLESDILRQVQSLPEGLGSLDSISPGLSSINPIAGWLDETRDKIRPDLGINVSAITSVGSANSSTSQSSSVAASSVSFAAPAARAIGFAETILTFPDQRETAVFADTSAGGSTQADGRIGDHVPKWLAEENSGADSAILVQVSLVVDDPNPAQEIPETPDGRDRDFGAADHGWEPAQRAELHAATNEATAAEEGTTARSSIAGQRGARSAASSPSTATNAQGDSSEPGVAGSLSPLFQLQLLADFAAVGAVAFVMAGKRKAASPVDLATDKLTDADKKLGNAAQQVAKEMEDGKWKPKNAADGGEFGTEMHDRVERKLAKEKGWTFDVYVDKKTNKVISVGEPPKGVPSTEYTQVDAIHGKPIKVGVELGPDNVNEVYDLKTAANGQVMKPDQRRRLKLVKFGVDATDLDTKNIKVVTPPRRYSPITGWGDHPRFGQSGVKLLQFLGPAFAIYSILSVDTEAAQIDFQNLVGTYANIKQDDQIEVATFVNDDVRSF